MCVHLHGDYNETSCFRVLAGYLQMSVKILVFPLETTVAWDDCVPLLLVPPQPPPPGAGTRTMQMLLPAAGGTALLCGEGKAESHV